MSKDRSLVRASDIGSWTFCNRAWWLSRVKDVPHRNPTLLQRGDDVHQAHGRQVARAYQLNRLGMTLIAISLLLAGLALLGWLFTQL